ncbi:penicillin acylase family protein [Effusibacillus pohliae]|uniref:penicillin acylase family protein n=1 Tax=Effusibacillus pohliae TaxID=232270 RepID=UPI00035D434E|nr:penicillin acylase family protein [Effusibacillus pohliae]
MKRLFKWSAIVLVALLVIGLAGGGWFVRRSIPVMQGISEPTGVRQAVKIYRDEWGIPHIYAKSLEDAFFAQGYAQAQDRLFEMDLSRRAVQGKLSEILGEKLLDADKFFLAVGFYRAGQGSEQALTPEFRNYLQRYADGVNAFVAQNRSKLPPEFTLLGYEPEPWTPTDSLAIGKYMSWVLGGNMETELLLMAAVDKLGEAKAKEIFPSDPKDGATIMQEAWRKAGGTAQAAEQLLALIGQTGRKQAGIPGVGVGSNNWVVGGSMTKSGLPILANDMHLEIKAPSIWYQNHLHVPGELNVTGVIFPGVPGVVVGHNDSVAWGVTNVNPDVQDLYIEKRNPNNPRQFEFQEKWENAQVFSYDIPVKGKAPVPFEVLVTRHGPVISDVFKQSAPLALKWTNHLPTTELQAIIGFDRAKNWQEFKQALDQFKVPAQNFVFADKQGTIAYRANGLIPIRAKGDGLLPVPGWTGEYEWIGYIPYDQLPTVVNPKQGFIVTANNKVIDDQYPYFLTHEWAPPYRAQSIFESLNGKKDLTLQDVVSIQNNWNNLQARKLAPILKEALGQQNGSGETERAKALLLKWLDGNPQDNPNEPGPTIYHTLYLKMLKNTFADELGEQLYNDFLSHGNAVNTMDRFLLEGSSWFDDVTTPKQEDRTAIILKSFDDAVADLGKRLGKDPDGWTWGKLHTITFDHPLGVQAGLNLILNKGPFGMGGSSVTVGAASYPLKHPYEVTSSAPWRYGVDLANLNQAVDILFGGSSGHPFSQHYDDQIDKWLQGQYKTMWFSDEDVQRAAGDRVLVLRP